MSQTILTDTEQFKETKAITPPMETTDEAKRKHLNLAKVQGNEFQKALSEMTDKVAQRGTEKAAGHYLVGYAFEKPEGMYVPMNGELQWQEPRDENLHIEISVRDGADGRFIPGLNIELMILDGNGDEVGTHKQPFLWHPWLYHYGRNWKLPADGKYTFRIKIEMPAFPRHDKKNGKRFTEPVLVEFRDVPIKIYPPNSD